MRDVDPRAVAMALSHANYLGFAAAVATTLLGFWLRAVRWRWLIASPRRLTTESLFSATMIGFMANNILPLRLRQFVRAWALSPREGLAERTLPAAGVGGR